MQFERPNETVKWELNSFNYRRAVSWLDLIIPFLYGFISSYEFQIFNTYFITLAMYNKIKIHIVKIQPYNITLNYDLQPTWKFGAKGIATWVW